MSMMETVSLIERLTNDEIVIGIIIVLVITQHVMRAISEIRIALVGTGCLMPILLILGLLLLAEKENREFRSEHLTTSSLQALACCPACLAETVAA
jgi:hypothetical protein